VWAVDEGLPASDPTANPTLAWAVVEPTVTISGGAAGCPSTLDWGAGFDYSRDASADFGAAVQPAWEAFVARAANASRLPEQIAVVYGGGAGGAPKGPAVPDKELAAQLRRTDVSPFFVPHSAMLRLEAGAASNGATTVLTSEGTPVAASDGVPSAGASGSGSGLVVTADGTIKASATVYGARAGGGAARSAADDGRGGFEGWSCWSCAPGKAGYFVSAAQYDYGMGGGGVPPPRGGGGANFDLVNGLNAGFSTQNLLRNPAGALTVDPNAGANFNFRGPTFNSPDVSGTIGRYGFGVDVDPLGSIVGGRNGVNFRFASPIGGGPEIGGTLSNFGWNFNQGAGSAFMGNGQPGGTNGVRNGGWGGGPLGNLGPGPYGGGYGTGGWDGGYFGGFFAGSNAGGVNWASSCQIMCQRAWQGTGGVYGWGTGIAPNGWGPFGAAPGTFGSLGGRIASFFGRRRALLEVAAPAGAPPALPPPTGGSSVAAAVLVASAAAGVSAAQVEAAAALKPVCVAPAAACAAGAAARCAPGDEPSVTLGAKVVQHGVVPPQAAGSLSLLAPAVAVGRGGAMTIVAAFSVGGRLRGTGALAYPGGLGAALVCKASGRQGTCSTVLSVGRRCTGLAFPPSSCPLPALPSRCLWGLMPPATLLPRPRAGLATVFVPAPPAPPAGAGAPAAPAPLPIVRAKRLGAEPAASEAARRAGSWPAPPALAVRPGMGLALAVAEPPLGSAAPAWVSVVDLLPAAAAMV
jgi:hypothetical protein